MTRHLTIEELVDVAEGAREEASLPHLTACAACREQLSGLRAAMREVASVEMTEPSPLFWDHLSARVRDAIAASPAPAGPWWSAWRSGLLSAAALAVVVLAALVLSARFHVPGAAKAPSVAAAPEAVTEPSALPADDEVFGMMAALAADAADDGGVTEVVLTVRPGAVDAALTTLNDSERRELERLLKQELEQGA